MIEDKENKLNYYHILAVMKVLLCYSFEKTYVEISKDFILHLFDLCEMSPVKEFISYLFSPDIDDENKDAITRQRLDYEARLNEWRIMPEMMSRIYEYILLLLLLYNMLFIIIFIVMRIQTTLSKRWNQCVMSLLKQ